MERIESVNGNGDGHRALSREDVKTYLQEEQRRAAIAHQQRVAEATEALKALCDERGITLTPVVVITPAGFQARVEVGVVPVRNGEKP